MTTKIDWCDEVWNPITGCTKITAGCKNCYAKRMAQRLKGRFGYPEDDPFKVTFHLDRLYKPLKWKNPRRVFVCSMGDLFHDEVSEHVLDSIWSMMWTCLYLGYNPYPGHIFQILTKRPQNAFNYLNSINIKNYRLAWAYNSVNCSEAGDAMFDQTYYTSSKPHPRIWLGVSISTQEDADNFIPILLKTPAAVRFVSIEPQLKHIFLKRYIYKLDWVICGAESGTKKRPFNEDWAKFLKDQCLKANIPFFYKQNSKEKMPMLDNKVWNEFPNK